MHQHVTQFAPSPRGFTLLEVMIAIVILSFLMMSAALITSRCYGARERFDKRDEIFHQGAVAIDRITRDLDVTFLARQLVAGSAADSALTPPPASDSTVKQKWKTFFIGEDRGNEDALRFTALSHIRMTEDAKESDQCRVAYEVVPSKEKSGSYDLVRREEAWLNEDVLVTGAPLILAEGIKGFDLEYYDERKGEWGREWNTDRPDWQWKLPPAVRITLAFPAPAPDGEEMVFTTAISIPLSAGVIEM